MAPPPGSPPGTPTLAPLLQGKPTARQMFTRNLDLAALGQALESALRLHSKCVQCEWFRAHALRTRVFPLVPSEKRELESHFLTQD